MTSDELEIRKSIEDWAVLRDARDWDKFIDLWHADGVMKATWFQGTASEFIEMSQQGWDRGVRILHVLGGAHIEITEDRAVSQTKMTIMQRAQVHGIECDVECFGRFYDFWIRENGRWLLLLRQPIYEQDRMLPVNPVSGATSVKADWDAETLQSYPLGYRHLAYMQIQSGMEVKYGLPGIEGPELEKLYAEGTRWLSDGEVPARMER